STRWNSTWTGRPMRTWSGSVPVSSPTIRTPSSSATSAITIGSVRPGTGGGRGTTEADTPPLPGAAADPGGHDVAASLAAAARAHRAGRVAQLPAVVAALDPQLPGRRPGPEEL